MTTIDNIIETIAVSPGTSVGLSAADLKATWKGMCLFVQESLQRHRSAVIPNFANFMLQQHVDHSGTWGARVTYIPSVQLLPAFSSAYSVANRTEMRISHVGAQSSVVLNCSAITAAVDGAVSRHGVMNCVKDIVRGIGNVVATGKNLTLNMGCCVLRFHGRTLSSDWSKSFLDGVNSEARAVGRPTTAPKPMAKKTPAPPKAKEQVEAAVAEPVQEDEAASDRSDSPRHSRQGSATPRRGDSTASTPRRLSAASSRASQQPPQTRPVPRPPSEHFSATSRPGSVSAKEAMLECRHLMRQIEDDSGEHYSPHASHKLKKRMFRRLRGQAFQDAWEQNMREKQQSSINEFQKDVRTSALFVKAAEEAKEQEKKEREERRRMERETQEVNSQLISARQGSQLPSSQPSGDIFAGKRMNYVTKPDLNILLKQIEEKQQREAQEREANDRYLQKAKHEDEAWKQEQLRKKQEKMHERQKLLSEYERVAHYQARQKALQEEQERREAKMCGIDFAGAGDQFKDRSRQIQIENYELLKARAEQERLEAVQAQKRREKEAKLEAKREAAMRTAEKNAKKNQQDQMSHVWRRQMAERVASREKEKRDLACWRDTAFLKNESSDSEDDI